MTAQKRGSSSGFLIFMFGLVGLLFAAYTAYWFYARGQLEDGVLEWIGEERARGVAIDYTSLDMKGYPYRFALHVDAPTYRDPSGVQWSGETLQLVMQPWDWNHVIGRAPGRSDIAIAGRSVQADLGEKSVGSLSWTKDGLNRLSVQLDDATMVDDLGDTWTARDFQLHLRPPADDPDALQVVLQWERLGLPAVVEAAPYLGQDIQASRLLIEVFDAFPVINSGRGLREWATLGGKADVAQLILNWGPLQFGATADLTLDVDARVDGVINVRLDDGEDLIEAMLGSGMEPESFAQASMAITLLGGASEDGGFLPLTVRDGEIRYLGQTLAEIPPAF